MLSKWSAVNEPKVGGDVPTESDEAFPQESVEAQESNLKQRYETALSFLIGKSVATEKLKEARDAFMEILSEDIIRKVNSNSGDVSAESGTGTSHSSRVNIPSQIKFLSLRNLALVEQQLGHLDDAQQHLLDALLLDDSDGFLWNKIGQISLSCSNLELARHSFEAALGCTQGKRANTLECLTGLLETCRRSKDTFAALRVCETLCSMDPLNFEMQTLRQRLVQQLRNPAGSSNDTNSAGDTNVFVDLIRQQHEMIAEFCVQQPTSQNSVQGESKLTTQSKESDDENNAFNITKLSLQESELSWELLFDALLTTLQKSQSADKGIEYPNHIASNDELDVISNNLKPSRVVISIQRQSKNEAAVSRQVAQQVSESSSSEQEKAIQEGDQTKVSNSKSIQMKHENMLLDDDDSRSQTNAIAENVANGEVSDPSVKRSIDQVEDAEQQRKAPKQLKETKKPVTRRRSSRMKDKAKSELHRSVSTGNVFSHTEFYREITEALVKVPDQNWKMVCWETFVSEKIPSSNNDDDSNVTWLTINCADLMEKLKGLFLQKCGLHRSTTIQSPKQQLSSNEVPSNSQSSLVPTSLDTKPDEVERSCVMKFVEQHCANPQEITGVLWNLIQNISNMPAHELNSSVGDLAKRIVSTAAVLKRAHFLPAFPHLDERIDVNDAKVILHVSELYLDLAMRDGTEVDDVGYYMKEAEAGCQYVAALVSTWQRGESNMWLQGIEADCVEFVARTWWLIGRTADMRDHTEEAIAALERCQEVLSESTDLTSDITIPHCALDNTLSVEIVKGKVVSLKSTNTARRARALYIGTLEGNMVEGDKIASMHAIVEILLGKFLPQAKRNPLLLEGPINNVNEVVKDYTLFSLSKDQMEDNGPDIVELFWNCCVATEQYTLFVYFAQQLLSQLLDRTLGTNHQGSGRTENTEPVSLASLSLVSSNSGPTANRALLILDSARASLFVHVLQLLGSKADLVAKSVASFPGIKSSLENVVVSGILLSVGTRDEVSLRVTVLLCTELNIASWALDVLMFGVITLLNGRSKTCPSNLTRERRKQWKTCFDQEQVILTAGIKLLPMLFRKCSAAWDVVQNPKDGQIEVVQQPHNQVNDEQTMRYFQVVCEVLRYSDESKETIREKQDALNVLFHSALQCLFEATRSQGLCGLFLKCAYVYLDSDRVHDKHCPETLHMIRKFLEEPRLILALRNYSVDSGDDSEDDSEVAETRIATLEKLRKDCIEECYRVEYGVILELLPVVGGSLIPRSLPSVRNMDAIQSIFDFLLPYLVADSKRRTKSIVKEILALCFEVLGSNYCQHGPFRDQINNYLYGAGIGWTGEESEQDDCGNTIMTTMIPKQDGHCKVSLPKVCVEYAQTCESSTVANEIGLWLSFLCVEYTAVGKITEQFHSLALAKPTNESKQGHQSATCSENSLAALAMKPVRSMVNQVVGGNTDDDEDMRTAVELNVYEALCREDLSFNPWRMETWHNLLCSLREQLATELKKASCFHELIPKYLKKCGGPDWKLHEGTDSNETTQSGPSSAAALPNVEPLEVSQTHVVSCETIDPSHFSHPPSMLLKPLELRSSSQDQLDIDRRRKALAVTSSTLIGIVQHRIELCTGSDDTVTSVAVGKVNDAKLIVPGATVSAKWSKFSDYAMATVVRVHDVVHSTFTGRSYDLCFEDGVVVMRAPENWLKNTFFLPTLDPDIATRNLVDAHEAKALMLYNKLHEVRYIQPGENQQMVRIAQECITHFRYAELVCTDDLEKRKAFFLLMQGKLLRKIGQKPSRYLKSFARAVELGTGEDIEQDALYNLHSARLKLALALISGENVKRDMNDVDCALFDWDTDTENGDDEDAIIHVLSKYAFEDSNQFGSIRSIKEIETFLSTTLSTKGGCTETESDVSKNQKLQTIVINCIHALDYCHRLNNTHHQAVYRIAWAITKLAPNTGNNFAKQLMDVFFVSKRSIAQVVAIWMRNSNTEYELVLDTQRKFDYFRIRYTIFYAKLLCTMEDSKSLLQLVRLFSQAKDDCLAIRFLARSVFHIATQQFNRQLTAAISVQEGTARINGVQMVLENLYALYIDGLSQPFLRLCASREVWKGLQIQVKLLVIRAHTVLVGSPEPCAWETVMKYCETKWKRGGAAKAAKAKLKLSSRR